MSAATNLLSANTAGIETDSAGWTAGANTVKARTTARFYAEASSLRLTATAAGTVTATTTDRVAVVAGTEYTAYAYMANIVAAAGRAGTVSVSWYAGPVGGSPISTVTSDPITLANATTWTEPPPILIATAPAGATYASMTLTVTGLSAAAQVVCDVMTFGPPNIVAGNLMPYNTQGLEVSVAGWAAETNASITRVTTNSYEGWASMQSTATAAGDMEVRTVAMFPVTAGTEYFASMLARPSAAGLTFRPEVMWLNASNAAVGTRLSYSWTPAAAAWTRVSASGVAPPGAVKARLVVFAVATAPGQTWITDQMVLRPAPILESSYLRYNEQSFEESVGGWNADEGCTIARSTARAWEGGASMAVTTDGTGQAVVRVIRDFPVTPRQVYRVAPYIYHAVLPTQFTVDLLYSWYDADGVFIHTSYFRWILGSGAGWWAPVGSATAPAGSATVNVGIRFINPPTAEVFYVDNVAVGPGGIGIIADPIPGAYGAAISMQGITTGGYTHWGLWRMAPDGALIPIRGSDGEMSDVIITGDAAVAEDYEAPLGEPIRYYLRVWTSPALYVATYSDPITLPEPDDKTVILKDPGMPARITTAVVGTLPDWTRAARQGVNAVRGRARPIVISDVRTSRAGPMTLVTETREDLDAMWWLLETGNTIFLQWPRSWGERDIYVQVGDVTETHIVPYAGFSDRTWSVPLIEVDRPTGGVMGSADRTWEDVEEDNTDWLSVLTSHASWLDVYAGTEAA